jgi:hypothetical protein
MHTLLGLAASLVLMSLLGYLVIRLLPAEAFNGFPDRPIVSLLVGISLSGLTAMVAARLLDGTDYFDVGLAWSVPLLLVLLVPLNLVSGRGFRWAAMARVMRDPSQRLQRSSLVSIGILVIGVALLLVLRTGPMQR